MEAAEAETERLQSERRRLIGEERSTEHPSNPKGAAAAEEDEEQDVAGEKRGGKTLGARRGGEQEEGEEEETEEVEAQAREALLSFLLAEERAEGEEGRVEEKDGRGGKGQ